MSIIFRHRTSSRLNKLPKASSQFTDSLCALALCLTLIFSTQAKSETKSETRPAEAPLLDYQPTTGIAGNLWTIGSSSMADLMTLWRFEYQRYYPNSRVLTHFPGSSGGAAALYNGKAQLAAMTRKMKVRELTAFHKKYGFEPTAIPVAIDMLAVIVNKENPVEALTPQHLDAIFSSTRVCGAPKDIAQWGQLGLTDAWQSLPIELHGYDDKAGAHGYFSKLGLCGGQFRPEVQGHSTAISLVKAVANSMSSIGFTSITALSEAVKPVPLVAAQPGQSPLAPTADNATEGSYPFTRLLYIYVLKSTTQPLTAAAREFILLALSQSGQALVSQYGYVPLSSEMVKQARLALQ